MNYQDDIPLAKRIRSIKTLSNKSFLRLGLLLVGLSISLSFLANKSFLRQTKSLDNAISSSKTKQNKSLLGHLKEISVVDFDHSDVVRHPLVSKIVKAYSDQNND